MPPIGAATLVTQPAGIYRRIVANARTKVVLVGALLVGARMWSLYWYPDAPARTPRELLVSLVIIVCLVLTGVTRRPSRDMLAMTTTARRLSWWAIGTIISAMLIQWWSSMAAQAVGLVGLLLLFVAAWIQVKAAPDAASR